MHMADALLSPAVGGTLWLASGTALAVCARRVRSRNDDRLMPLMGVLGAFVFAAQMVNFAIPATGSSGHLGGGLLLAILLGPAPALLVIASVLMVQALFFADGGLLALGANIFNLGVLPCLLAYPLIYRPLVRAGGATPSALRTGVAAMLAAVAGLQLGALGVVLQTVASGVSALPVETFLWLMLPIHLAIGLVEGAATCALVLFLRRARPDLLRSDATPARGERSLRPVLAAVVAVALFTGSTLSWFASNRPDGLEWSIAHAAGVDDLPTPGDGLHAGLAAAQQRLAWLPGYDFADHASARGAERAQWPAVRPGTSLAGLVGGLVTLALVCGAAWLLRRQRSR